MKNKILPLVAFVFVSTATLAQSATESSAMPPPKDSVRSFLLVQSMPEFKGEGTFYDYLASNITYPAEEKQKGIQGTVYVTFIVGTDGSVSDVHIKQGTHSSPGLEAEALRVINSMPAWKPGTLNGAPVAIQMTQPVKFALKGNKKKK